MMAIIMIIILELTTVFKYSSVNAQIGKLIGLYLTISWGTVN